MHEGENGWQTKGTRRARDSQRRSWKERLAQRERDALRYGEIQHKGTNIRSLLRGSMLSRKITKASKLCLSADSRTAERWISHERPIAISFMHCWLSSASKSPEPTLARNACSHQYIETEKSEIAKGRSSSGRKKYSLGQGLRCDEGCIMRIKPCDRTPSECRAVWATNLDIQSVIINRVQVLLSENTFHCMYVAEL